MYRGFHIDTQFITNYGTKTFGDFTNGQRIKVMDKDGIWRDAIVRHYNPDNMHQITLTKGNETRNIICSLDHRWLLLNNLKTVHLAKGHMLYPFAHGIYYNISTTGTKIEYEKFWTVTDVRVIGQGGVVCCIEEPATHSFCLEGNIVTGDCY